VTPLPAPALRIEHVEALVFRAPIATPVRTSFGVMHDRPALFLRVTDADGAQGWGEAWCNFPSCGAEHRRNLVDTVLAPLLTAQAFAGPAAAFAHLSERTAVLAIQSGEPGPLAQAIAGLDLALWDLCARRAQQPLWRYLGGASDRIDVYASGINPDRPHETAARMLAQGHRAFKLKLGFGTGRDLANLRSLRATLGDGHRLMVDANQAWTLADALAIVPQLAPFALGWLEEPLRADRPWPEWQALAASSPVPLAGGENLAGFEQFAAALDANVFAVVQPDAAKWGGISGCRPVIESVQRAGRTYCPHYLGGGIGLLASAHLLAAAGGTGMLEIDSNPNPLRSALGGALGAILDGQVRLGDAPGIGIAPDPAQLRERCRAPA
jgi:L-alanine-DL-glutamate epimerase-like enolase superfamily enzyme